MSVWKKLVCWCRNPATAPWMLKPLGELVVTKLPLYEYRDVWAEEGAALNANTDEWSFGNGATGVIGIAVGSGWEAVSMSFHADAHTPPSQVTVNAVDRQNAGAVTIASITLTGPTDGGGQVNNSFKVVEYSPPIPLADNAVVGFRTGTKTGTVNNARVCIRLRRPIGEYVSDVGY